MRCTTLGCPGEATRLATADGVGTFAYCDDCAAFLIGAGETDKGPVPPVHWNRALAAALVLLAVMWAAAVLVIAGVA